MTKRQLIEEITVLNPTAAPVFLARFEDRDLEDYLSHLLWVQRPQARSRQGRCQGGPSAGETPRPAARREAPARGTGRADLRPRAGTFGKAAAEMALKPQAAPADPVDDAPSPEQALDAQLPAQADPAAPPAEPAQQPAPAQGQQVQAAMSVAERQAPESSSLAASETVPQADTSASVSSSEEQSQSWLY